VTCGYCAYTIVLLFSLTAVPFSDTACLLLFAGVYSFGFYHLAIYYHSGALLLYGGCVIIHLPACLYRYHPWTFTLLRVVVGLV